jgi:hypothetical protein
MDKETNIVTGKFYGSLYDGLFKVIPQSNLEGYAVFYKITGRGEGQRRFAAFRDYTEFFLFYVKQPDDTKEYHECILGQFRQKFRYDIDLKADKVPNEYKEKYGDEALLKYGDQVRDRLLRKTIDHLKDKYKIETTVEKDFLICTSHDVLCEEKYSCHIILHTYCVARHEMAKQLFEEIVFSDERLVKDIDSGIIDSSIYASLKSFRMLGSGKRYVNEVTNNYSVLRHKKILYEFEFEGKTVKVNYPKNTREQIILFRKTCISDTVHCEMINVNLPEKKVFEGSDFEIANCGEITSILDKESGNAFKLLNIRNNILFFNRIRPSFCKLCGRDHEKVGVFLTTRSNGALFYHCYLHKHGKNPYQIGVVTVKIKNSPTKQTPREVSEDCRCEASEDCKCEASEDCKCEVSKKCKCEVTEKCKCEVSENCECEVSKNCKCEVSENYKCEAMNYCDYSSNENTFTEETNFQSNEGMNLQHFQNNQNITFTNLYQKSTYSNDKFESLRGLTLSDKKRISPENQNQNENSKIVKKRKKEDSFNGVNGGFKKCF